jgi:UDP-N-acetylmuramoylalanine--D-glutamate ligase
MVKDKKYLVFGLGKTGYSCVKYLAAEGFSFVVFDTRPNPPFLAQLQTEFPHVKLYLENLPSDVAHNYNYWVMSPGIDFAKQDFYKFADTNTVIIGDLELWFAKIASMRSEKKPIVIGVTGSNGKSTVVTLLGALLNASRIRSVVIGNIGEPVLNFIDADVAVYVLECSSFQLLLTNNISTEAAACLNLSPDHLDYHGTMENYLLAKQRIYKNCKHPVINIDENLYPGKIPDSAITYSVTKEADYFLREGPVVMLSSRKYGDILPLMDLSPALINYPENALAALALVDSLSLELQLLVAVLKNFVGLNHRLHHVGKYSGALWFNDSKATNVGAAEGALKTLYKKYQQKLFWVAGGQAKGADLSVLNPIIQQTVKYAVLIGEARDELAACCKTQNIDYYCASSLADGIAHIKKLVKDDIVVLAPACASLDMFDDYTHRGRCYEELIKAEGLDQ